MSHDRVIPGGARHPSADTPTQPAPARARRERPGAGAASPRHATPRQYRGDAAEHGEPTELVADDPAADLDAEPTGSSPPSVPAGRAALPRLSGRGKRGRRLVKPDDIPRTSTTPEQRLLLLDTWQRSGLPAGDFAALVGISKHTRYAWKKKFDRDGPAGLMDQPRVRCAAAACPS